MSLTSFFNSNEGNKIFAFKRMSAVWHPSSLYWYMDVELFAVWLFCPLSMQICTNRCKWMLHSIETISVWQQLWLLIYTVGVHVRFPLYIHGKYKWEAACIQISWLTEHYRRRKGYSEVTVWTVNDGEKQMMITVHVVLPVCVCVCNDHWPPAGGTTWSSSFMLVLFQIFLITALSSSLACSRLPWQWQRRLNI